MNTLGIFYHPFSKLAMLKVIEKFVGNHFINLIY